MTEYIGWMSFCFAMVILALVQQQKADVERKLSQLEQKVDKILSHLEIATGSPVPPEVGGLLQAGRRIEAIKVYRRAAGVSVKEAEEVIDRLESKQIMAP